MATKADAHRMTVTAAAPMTVARARRALEAGVVGPLAGLIGPFVSVVGPFVGIWLERIAPMIGEIAKRRRRLPHVKLLQRVDAGREVAGMLEQSDPLHPLLPFNAAVDGHRGSPRGTPPAPVGHRGGHPVCVGRCPVMAARFRGR